jgi:hypothetical protein
MRTAPRLNSINVFSVIADVATKNEAYKVQSV